MLEGFKTFNFNEGAPYVSITKNGATFNKSVIMKLGYPEYVCLLINAQAKQIAIQVASKETTNATPFYTEEKKQSGILSIRWNGRDLLNTLKDITEWDLSKVGYRVDGKYLPEDNAILFDLNLAIELK